MKLGVKECKGEGSTSSPVRVVVCGVRGNVRSLEEPRREKHLIEPGVTVNVKLKRSFTVVVMWGLPPLAHPCACNVGLFGPSCLSVFIYFHTPA